ncbi:hypothetical protein SDJN02_11204 [Cucurbita argyrosperma subsp. argyrosperma]|nr:hypothetical protein SDJN02_11204 [Cucurbita argyrosperma subsp. argyrosperma]
MAAITHSTKHLIRHTTVNSRPSILSTMASHPSLVFVGWNTRRRQFSKLSGVSSPCPRNMNLAPKSSEENTAILPSEDNPEDGVSLGTMKLPSDIDIAKFEVLLFQWANSLCQGANLPLPVPLRVDKITSGVRTWFYLNWRWKDRNCLVFPATASSSPIFRAIRNGRLKDQSPPGEPRIMRSLLSALKKSVEIAVDLVIDSSCEGGSSQFRHKLWSQRCMIPGILNKKTPIEYLPLLPALDECSGLKDVSIVERKELLELLLSRIMQLLLASRL